MHPDASPDAMYDDAIAALYDHVGAHRHRGDLAFFVDQARAAGGPVLEIGSGTGRVLLPTARVGVSITGLEASPAMLSACRAALAGEPDDVRARVTLVDSDMRALALDRRFALITVPFRTFQLLTTTGVQRAVLTRFREHLEPGGRLVLDLFAPWMEALVYEGNRREHPCGEPTSLPDGATLIPTERVLSHDPVAQTQEMELCFTVVREGGPTERHVQRFTWRYTFRHEAEHLLTRCGFELVDAFADYEGTPFGARHPSELVLVARRT